MSDLDTQVTDFTLKVVSAMGLSLASTIEETPDHVRINLTGDDADVLLKRQGEALDALQVIVNTVFRRDARGDRHYVIDAQGFRKNKDDELRQTALALAAKAKATGAPQEIGPLNPYDRRVVHLAISSDAGVKSLSLGDAFLKTIVISTT